MSPLPPQPGLKVNVVCTAIDSAPTLLELLDEHADASVMWGPHGGVVGWGVAARFDGTWSAAVRWWHELAQSIHHYTGPALRCLVSVPFSSDSLWPVTLLVCEQMVIVEREQAWQLEIRAEKTPDKPPRTEPTNSSIDYRDLVTTALAAISPRQLDKVVVAHAVAQPLPAISYPGTAMVAALARRYPMCWIFHLDGLVGASPEPLLRKHGRDVSSRVLAGTLPAAASSIQRTNAACRNGKIAREHDYSLASVISALEPFCGKIDPGSGPFWLELPNVWHRASDITATLKPKYDLADVLPVLHPTAAVCGQPRQAAMQAIQSWEGFDRGRYAGPVGWWDTADNAEFAIALRCGQISPDHRSIMLYAGAGIVAGSDPDQEWCEVQNKLQPMQQALRSLTNLIEAGAEPDLVIPAP